MRASVASLTAILLSLCLLSACSGKSLELATPPVNDNVQSPDNLAWWSRAAMDALLRFSVWSGNRSGYIVLFARDGVPVYGNAVGFKDIDSGAPMTMDTHVNIASMTKPITAVLAMMLVEQGRLGLDDPVAQYLPEFANLRVATSEQPGPDEEFPSAPAASPILVRHLLMFASGIGPGREEGSALVDYWYEHGIYRQSSGSLGERVARLAQLPLLEEPGTRWRYGYSADVLGRVIEVVTGHPLALEMRERILQPLGMSATRYLPPPGQRRQLATIYTQDEHGKLVVAPMPDDTDWTPGGGRLVSTAADYMRFALMLWHGGEYRGVRLLQQATVDDMRRLHVPSGVLAAEGIDGIGWGLGMAVVADADASKIPDRDGDFWWAGYYGTTFFVSPSTGLTGVLISQNEPSEHSGIPVVLYLAQGLAFAGI